MKLLRGFREAQAELGRRRTADWDAVPPGMAELAVPIFGEALPPQEVVRRILHEVREHGDVALRTYAERLDGYVPDSFEVSPEAIESAAAQVPADLMAALDHAAQRVRAFHRACLPKGWVDSVEGYGERFTPLQRVGIYVPGGTAVYPSTVVMTAIPARVAGVPEIIVATPPRGARGPDPAVLAACQLAGVDRVFQIGGAQAIGAMAYGTQSVPRVDMVCGPGNLFVTLAKRQVYGEVAVDGLYGPSETVVIADARANPELCAADLLAQAEHDTLATPILITVDAALVPKVEEALERQLATLERAAIARQALDRQGRIAVVDTLDQAIELANQFAPEHLCLLVEEPWGHLDKVKNAGGVFLGEATPEVLGDYVAGPSHVMPTGGTARFGSPLGVHQFLKVTSVVGFTPGLLRRLAGPTAAIARHEGLTGHARAVEMRVQPERGTIG